MPRDPVDNPEGRRLQREGLKEKIRELEEELRRKELQMEAVRLGRSEALSPAVKKFIEEHLGSAEDLEILLMLQKGGRSARQFADAFRVRKDEPEKQDNG